MKITHKLYCVGRKDCAQGFSCIGGECIEDIVPDPPLVGGDNLEETPESEEKDEG